MNILFDWDNTLDIKQCDIDDGMALVYLLGQSHITIEAITCTYGNSDVDTVYNASKTLLNDIGLNIPLIKGAASKGSRQSDASHLLVDRVNSSPGKYTLLATGSLTNIYAAWQLDNGFFTKLKGVSLMGGVTKPLYLGNKLLDELNFSCDAEASYHVITNSQNLAITTGNNCLKAFTSRVQHERRLRGSDAPIATYLLEKTAYWFDLNKQWNLDGVYQWDVLAAAYLAQPELFEENIAAISPTINSLETGCLLDRKEMTVTLPTIKSVKEFEDAMYESYLRVRW